MNTGNKHVNDDLLIKYIIGEAGDQDRALTEKWINESDENRQRYIHIKQIWDESSEVISGLQADENAAWNRLQKRIKTSGSAPGQNKKNLNLRWLQVAAAIIVAGICGLIFYRQFYLPTNLLTYKTQNSIRTEILPDGSVVTLNAHSTIVFPARFSGEQRNITLAGEAFFNVQPDKSKPFLIRCGQVTVRVVGTSFNVKSNAGKTEVNVETGVVRVNNPQSSIELHPGEKVTIRTESSSAVKEASKGKLYNYYITKELVCEQTPLSELVETLNKIYGSDIVIANSKIRSLPITTTFKQQSLNDILDVVSKTLDVKVRNNGKQISLY
ncbi:DUF4974 domain-containing protein [Pedobacter sp. HMF7647]|uniref:DUF4974 domain-containing protein n=1 Tax=Hufsiella arboris TaxID=2695275 RepID=A0A7K1Y7F4_9SPHI|nr:FecR domain-containing protein [Hufsiella arboris]MXV50502.1 DUF4974 domain-containing protein [Hufsiella arboris]